MPSPHEQQRICILGDSQLGSVRHALTQGLTTPPDGAEVEFWGAGGPSFRLIDWRKGAIRATGKALETALSINGQGRDHISPGDFDCVIFYGARLRTAEFFGPYAHWAAEHGHLPSAAVLQAAARDFMIRARPYRLAGLLAAKGCAAVFVPSPFYTKGVTDMAARGRFFDHYPGADRLSAQHRSALWAAMQAVAAADGVTLVPQPDETVTDGVLTREEFAVEGAVESGDNGHKSPAFAARWMADVWPLTQQQAHAA